jgi:cell division protein FtsQ
VSQKKLNIKKIIFAITWLILGVSGIVLLVAAIQNKNIKKCSGIEIEIRGVNNNYFIDKTDVLQIIQSFSGGTPKGRMISDFNLRAIENNLKKNIWIKNAELFFDNNELLRVFIDEREPIARVFSTLGKSFYVDSSILCLPLSDKFSARLPVFTGFDSDPSYLRKQDSSLLFDVKEISKALLADSFLMAIIEQVDITAQHRFEMIPKIGNQTILFGDAADVSEKCNKLRLFYKKIMPVAGWSKYSIVNLEFKNQVVAKLKDATDKSSDSLRTLQIMKMIAEKASLQAADSSQIVGQENERISSDSSMIQQSLQRDEANEVQMANTENIVSADSKKKADGDREKVIPKAKAILKKRQ